ncbi:MAG: DUF4129 domain-containing protein [Candidatus Omnitrophota bacterium]|nr:MAG: DUF4129 domain-containing protein [Candidatus Omnitrophota bacterium]
MKVKICVLFLVLSFTFYPKIESLVYGALAEPITTGQFRERLTSAAELLESIGEQDTSVPSRILRQLKRDFPSEMVVSTGKEDIDIQNGWFLDSLAKVEGAETEVEFRKALKLLKLQLSSLLNEVVAEPRPEEANPKILLASILSRKEFSQKKTHPAIKSFAERLNEKIKGLLLKVKGGLEKILEKLVSLVEKLLKLFPSPPNLESLKSVHNPLIIFIYVFIGILAVVFFVRYKWYLYFLRRTKKFDAQSLEFADTVELQRWEIAQERAEQALRNGDLKLAFHYLYLALLLFLEEKKLLIYHESTTNWEYIRQLKSHPSLHQNFQSLTNIFERMWYGIRPFNVDDYNKFLGGYNQIIKGFL